MTTAAAWGQVGVPASADGTSMVPILTPWILPGGWHGIDEKLLVDAIDEFPDTPTQGAL